MKLPILKRSFLKGFLTIFSLSATAFIFQACYGTPNDFLDDACFEGFVSTSDTNEPIPGIQVEIKGLDRVDTTNADGSYVLFAPLDSAYTLVFKDIDSSANGKFLQKEISIRNDYRSCYLNNVILESL